MSSEKDRTFDLLDGRDSPETRLQTIIGKHLSNLRSLWNEMGLDEDQRSERTETVIAHVDALLCRMIIEESEMVLKLVETIKEYNEKIFVLMNELHYSQAEELSKKPLIDEEIELKALLEELRTEKCRRMDFVKQLYKEDSAICKQMDIAAYSIDPSVVPTVDQLNELQIHIEENRRDMECRRDKLMKLKSKIVRLMTKLNLTPKSDIEKKIVIESIDKLPLTKEFSYDLETLLSELETRFDTYSESIRQQANELKGKLESLWKICHVEKTYRNSFQHVGEDDFEVHALPRYNAEISRWQAYYEERQDILEKIELWMHLWNEKLQYEEKDKDANRFLNRAGTLLQDQKDRKKLERCLPMIQDEIEKLLEQWNVSHTSEPIMLECCPVLEYLDHIQKEHEEKKKYEKIEKQMVRKQQFETELMYGTSPSSKRSALIRLRNTPNSVCKKNIGASTTYSCSNLTISRSPVVRSSFRCKPPPGLQRPVPKVDLRRKQNDKVGNNLTPLSLMNMNRGDISMDTTGSSRSYMFTQDIQDKGLQNQSTFIVDPTTSPTKVVKI